MVSRIVNQLYQMNVILEKMIEQNNTSEELHDIELYLYFERFQNTIIAFNIVLGALKEFFPEAYCIDDDENEENKGNRKLYELVYNEIRKLKDPEADEIKKAMKAAQHSIATFPKTTKAIYEESIKERLCDIVDVYDSLELLLKYNLQRL